MGAQDVSVDRLQPGVFIELDLPWHRHPFFFNKFKIRNEDDIAVLRDIGLSSVRFDPDRSDRQPLPSAPKRPRPTVVSKASPMADEKRRRIERLRARRDRFRRCDRAFKKQVNHARSVMASLKARPQQAMEEATELVDEMVDVLAAESDVMVHLMNDKAAHETLYFHSLNVAVLAMLLGRAMDLDRPTMQAIGLGALFHDVGKERIPHNVLYKRGHWTKAERDFVQQHPRYGVETARKIEGFPEAALKVIEQHHELLDGSGYPFGLSGEAISLPTRVVQVANVYDNHCNHRDPSLAKTPHQAMSYMMAKQSKQLDTRLIQLFIKNLGIYPPGSVVRLSNDMIGIVIGVDRRDLLNPSVLVYDAEVPKSEALVVDLVTEPDLSVTEELKPAELSPEVVSYLSPRTKVSYYFDGSPPKDASST